MILGNLVYMVVEKSSTLDMILNIVTAVATIGAVIVSLILSGKETRIKKEEEEKNNKVVKELIHISLKNSLDRMLRYRKLIENAQYLYEPKYQVQIEHIFYEEFKTSAFSFEANFIFAKYLNKNLTRDILFISTQLIVLEDIDINRVSLKWVNTYYEALSNLILLKETLEEINGIKDNYDKTGSFLRSFYGILNPIEKLVKKLEK